jgi:hypothetical protein
MKYKIYKIEKLGCDKIYIGITTESLELRLQKHFAKIKHAPNREISKWLDNTCNIFEIEDTDDKLRETYWIRFYADKLVNTHKHIHKIDPKEYHRKNMSKVNKQINPEYNRWRVKIATKAKKENLSFGEYRIRYNIPDFIGIKRIKEKDGI